jgi:hypothetical protein
MVSLPSHLGAAFALCTVLGSASVQGQAPPPAAAARSPSAAAPAEPAIANYLSWRLNNKILPVTDRASDSTGTQFLIEFDELILSIRPNHEFRASLRYRQTLASKGTRPGLDPIQKMTVYGTWAAVGNELRFVPDPRRGGNGLNILSGTFSGTRIDVPFDYRNGSLVRRATVVLVRNDNIL